MICCSICKEMVVSSVENVPIGEAVKRSSEHYATHSWLRRKLHDVAMFPRRMRLRRFQKETEVLWRTQKK